MGKDSSPPLSVIVPAYNALPYLRQTIESLVEQKVQGLEIILIDDRSTDRTFEVAKSLVAEYPEAGLVLRQQQSNRGVSTARNLGLGLATGKYCAFVDADDIVPPRSFERLLRLAAAHSPDVVVGNVEAFWERSGERIFKRYAGLEKQGVFRYELAGSLGSVPRVVYSPAVWAKLFRRRLLVDHSIRFEDGIGFAEDHPFVIASLMRADCISVCPDVVYHYRQDNNHSAMRARYEPQHFERIRDVVQMNLSRLDGWPRYYYTRRVLDYEILQNVSRIRLLPRGPARRAFIALRTALLECDESVREEYVLENPQHGLHYRDLMRGAFNTCWLRGRFGALLGA